MFPWCGGSLRAPGLRSASSGSRAGAGGGDDEEDPPLPSWNAGAPPLGLGCRSAAAAPRLRGGGGLGRGVFAGDALVKDGSR